MSAIEDQVCRLIQMRAASGLERYGTDMLRTDIDFAGWLIHLQSELLDGAIYIERTLHEMVQREAAQRQQHEEPSSGSHGT